MEAERQALADASRTCAESGLVVGSSGNLSVRIGEQMLITPRRARLEAVDPLTCVPVSLEDGLTDPGHGSVSDPSSETPLHRAVYEATGAGAVVHTHSHFATVLSTLVTELPAIHYGLFAFGGPVRVAPYVTFGTPELAEAVATALKGRRGALLANHGTVAIADTVAQAVDLSIQLEWLASVYYHARLGGTPALLDEAELARVTAHAETLRYGVAEDAR
ncbi:MAG TPA: class II aldolase/adducin family protein [Conexibacter sp.]